MPETYQNACMERADGAKLRCLAPRSYSMHVGDQCIVDDHGVLEFGHIISIEQQDSMRDPQQSAIIQRRATLQDQSRANESELRSRMAMDSCRAKSEQYELNLRLVKVHFNFDRTLLRVLFTADGRVDFRAMVKDLATELRARIEMRQIGVRDEAGLIGGMGPCGREMCCCQWLKEFESINVKMAKTQRISLNPNVISGMCGRLKCCLRYEYDCYREYDRSLPHDGAWVQTAEGNGVVIDKDVLARKVRVRLEDQRFMTFNADDVQPQDGGRRMHACPRQEAYGENSQDELEPSDQHKQHE